MARPRQSGGYSRCASTSAGQASEYREVCPSGRGNFGAAGGRGAVRAVELSRPVREYRESAGTAGAAVLDPPRARVGATGELVIPPPPPPPPPWDCVMSSANPYASNTSVTTRSHLCSNGPRPRSSAVFSTTVRVSPQPAMTQPAATTHRPCKWSSLPATASRAPVASSVRRAATRHRLARFTAASAGQPGRCSVVTVPQLRQVSGMGSTAADGRVTAGVPHTAQT